MSHPITTQQEIRRQFWMQYTGGERLPGWAQNQYPAATRCAFVDYIDFLQRNGDISEALAYRATL